MYVSTFICNREIIFLCLTTKGGLFIFPGSEFTKIDREKNGHAHKRSARAREVQTTRETASPRPNHAQQEERGFKIIKQALFYYRQN